MDEFPSNTHKEKKPVPSKKIEKIVEGKVVQRKKPLGKRLGESFMGGDAKTTGQYVLFDILVPSAQDMVVDMICSAAERMFKGEGGRSLSRRIRHTSNGNVPYNRMAQGARGPASARDEYRRELSQRGRADHDFEELVFEHRHEAQETIDRLVIQIEEYGTASVSDLYSAVGITASYTDEDWGWTDLRAAGIVRVKGAYLLDLPRPIFLKNTK